MTFEARHENYRRRCEASLARACREYLRGDSEVSRAAEYTLTGGGKRVRGVLVLAVCDMLRGDEPTAGAFAAAIEMIHAFSLIHDDLPCMDDDDLRRGRPAAHIAFGEANALLAGDLLAVEAFEVLAGDCVQPEAAALACGILAGASGAHGMIFGQELDLKYENASAGEDALHRIHACKTGALFLAAVQLGAAAAGVRPSSAPALAQYAQNLGLVFQIVDDILDAVATPEQMGKPTGGDARAGKTTFAGLLGIDEARRRAGEHTACAVAALRGAYGQAADFLARYAETLLNRIA